MKKAVDSIIKLNQEATRSKTKGIDFSNLWRLISQLEKTSQELEEEKISTNSKGQHNVKGTFEGTPEEVFDQDLLPWLQPRNEFSPLNQDTSSYSWEQYQ